MKSKSAVIWNNITQSEAAAAARNMYASQSFESDLVNSYAWDTAIVFIQAYSGDDDYSKEVGTTFSSSLVNTGTTEDKKCNIYDMASNASEWTTETSSQLDKNCTGRGGNHAGKYNYTADRGSNGTSDRPSLGTFRSVLYIIK